MFVNDVKVLTIFLTTTQTKSQVLFYTVYGFDFCFHGGVGVVSPDLHFLALCAMIDIHELQKRDADGTGQANIAAASVLHLYIDGIAGDSGGGAGTELRQFAVVGSAVYPGVSGYVY